MDGSSELPRPNTELSAIAPDIPEGLEQLGHYHTYSIDTSPDGSSSSVMKLRKLGDQHAGYKVVDKQNFTPEQINKFGEWITKAFDAVRPGKTSLQQLQQLDIADEIVQLVSTELKAGQRAQSSGEPGV